MEKHDRSHTVWRSGHRLRSKDIINSLGAFRSVLIKLTVQPANIGAAAAETGPVLFFMDTGAASNRYICISSPRGNISAGTNSLLIYAP